MAGSISEKLKAINQLSLQIMSEGDNLSVIKIAAEGATKIFSADFGFAWGKFEVEGNYKISYKTRSMTFEPIFPFEKNNSHAVHQTSLYDNDVKQENYKTKIDPSLK